MFLPTLVLALSQPGDRRMGARGGREEEEVSRLGEEAAEDLEDGVKKQVENEDDIEVDDDDDDDNDTMKMTMTMRTMFTMFSGHLHQGCWRMKSQVPIQSQHLRSSSPSPSPSPASSCPPPAASQSP